LVLAWCSGAAGPALAGQVGEGALWVWGGAQGGQAGVPDSKVGQGNRTVYAKQNSTPMLWFVSILLLNWRYLHMHTGTGSHGHVQLPS
jgi:hypothetical protein